MLTDLIISNDSKNRITLFVTDDSNTHVIVTVLPGKTFSHAFSGGWAFWNMARLEAIREGDDTEGLCTIAVGYIKSDRILTYDQWMRRGV